MTAQQVLAEVQAVGGHLWLLPPDRIGWDLPDAAVPELVPAIRAAKPELLRLLAAGRDDTCPACGTSTYRWQDSAGAWHCGKCEPDPRADRWEGVTLATLGDRAITLTAPARDLPAPREWVKTPAGLGDLICWEASGAEGLVRLFRPRQGQAALVWFPAERIIGEIEWSRRRA
ncbi:MAG TPA: hypothetical protein VE996_04520 [Terriglobales bacterium]|nr:hypothetical protein [Terriglobales bacterium]